MIGPVPLRAADRLALGELAPLLRRVAGLDPRTVARLQLTDAVATVHVRLPFAVLVSRGITVGADVAGRQRRPDEPAAVRDLTVNAVELVDWLDSEDPAAIPPASRDTDWRGGLPPSAGWRRVDTVPDTVIRPLVRQGALTLKEAAAREGTPGAQPRQATADALLDSVVLRVSHPHAPEAPLTLRTVSALTRMGFLPRGGSAHVHVAGRWLRLAAAFGSVYQERPGSGLDELSVVAR